MKKALLVSLQGVAVLCLMMVVAVGSVLAYEVKVHNSNSNPYTAHVEVYVQKLVYRDVECKFDVAPGTDHTCKTGGWCPSFVKVTINARYTIQLQQDCWGTWGGVDATCCWDVSYVVDYNSNTQEFYLIKK